MTTVAVKVREGLKTKHGFDTCVNTKDKFETFPTKNCWMMSRYLTKSMFPSARCVMFSIPTELNAKKVET